MKKFTILMLLAALFAFAASGFAQTLTTYIDNDANYGEGWSNGSNGNQDAFGAWTITETVAGGAGEGWIGEGIWPLDKTDFGVPPFSETGNAFGMIGKGDGHSVTAARSFRKPLDVGESFSLMMAVDYDCGGDPTSLKGFVVLSGTDEIVKVNHDAFPGPISVNGFNGGLSSLTNYGTTPMTWTFTQTDANTLKVEGTPRDSTQDNFVTNIACAAGSIDGFRLQSANQVNENEDKRQTYFNNFTLVQDLSGLQTAKLKLVEDNGDWQVFTPEATTFNFTVSIDGEPLAADLQVNVGVAGSFGTPSVRSVTIPAGQLSATFSVECTVNRSGNYANVKVEGGGSSDNWGIYGPSFVLNKNEQDQYFTVTRAEGSRWTDPWDLDAGDVVTFYINNNNHSFLDSNPYLTAVTDNGDALPVTADISTNWTVVYNDDEEHTFNTAWTYGQLTAGEVETDARAHFQVKFGDAVFYFDNEEGGYGFNVHAPAQPITLEGPDSVTAGDEAIFTATFTGFVQSSCTISVSPEGLATVDPASYEIFGDESTEITLTALQPGEVTLTVTSDDDESVFASKVVTIGAFVPALSLEPVAENGWAITAPESNVEFRVTCNRAPLADVLLSVSVADMDGRTPFDVSAIPETVVIHAGETSATFSVNVKATGNNCGINIGISDTADGGYEAAEYGIKGPTYRWSRSTPDTGDASWILPLGTEVEFWVNNDDNSFEAANAYVTATVKSGAIELAPWADAGEGGKYTSGKFTASSAGSWPLVVKYGDAQLFDWGYYVEGSGGEPITITSWTVEGNKMILTIDADRGNVWTASELEDGDWKWQETNILVNDGTATVTMTENFQVIKVTP